jgi:hypothetical protein
MSRRFLGALLIALMAVGSVVLWIGIPARTRVHPAWQRSLRGERHPVGPRSVLDVVMVCSVALALVAFCVWFFLFAGSSLPT